MESIGEIIDDHNQTVAEHVVIESSVTSNSSSSTSPSTISSPLSQVGPLLPLPAINSLRSNLGSSHNNVPNHLHSNNNSVVMLRSAAEYIESQQSHQHLDDLPSPSISSHNLYTHHTTMSMPGSSRIIKNHLGNSAPMHQSYHHQLEPDDDLELMKSTHNHMKQHSSDVIVTTIADDMQSPNDVEIMHQQYHNQLHQQQIHHHRNIRHHETISVIVQPHEECSRDSHGGLMSPQKLTPSSVTSLQSGNGTNDDLDATTYQTLTSVVNNYSRSSPTNDFSPNSSAYATLTPLQPLPPISTMSDKFAYGHVSNTANQENNENANTGYHNYTNGNGSNIQKSPTYSQDHHHSHSPQKLNVNVNSSSPNPYNYNNEIVIGTTDQYNGNRHNTRQQSEQLSPNLNSYATINRVSDLSHMTHLTSSPSPSPSHQTFHSHHRDTIVINSPSPPLVTTSLQQHKNLTGGNNNNGSSVQSNKSESLNSSSNSSKQFNSNNNNNNTVVTSSTATSSSASDGEEINTKEIAQRISAELKRYSIPQAIFAQRVLCRSQGTLSDLLRNPKPWSKLKSGRETFRRMFKWLQEPEFQRMSALRMAGEFCCFL